jgi:hypothetical protein
LEDLPTGIGAFWGLRGGFASLFGYHPSLNPQEYQLTHKIAHIFGYLPGLNALYTGGPLKTSKKFPTGFGSYPLRMGDQLSIDYQ